MKNKEGLTEKIPEKKRSKESVLGTLLFVVLIASTVASLVGVGFVAYTKWQMSRQESIRPSIMALTTEQAAGQEDATDQPMPSDVSAEQEVVSGTPVDASVEAKKSTISVLNGGGAKGSAAAAADFLKKEGYTQAAAGNATGDYTGVTVYYATGSEAAAASIKEVLVKKYPNTATKAALPGNKETTTAPITVILGK